ncbi:uncharacterized protein EI97DRAFT_422272 [Westerdykella ornata]|uniref:Uncharacterized protein n=1 Tax=Westerdykella ornata TaxID=318751 RepID=A0A6A6JDD3_WESOR|nr:uncharacterized protein EI97DRAFT_422272 [Westerdykella ornata]KAF2274571.1 hypothetical protein EI97DRAFT_422272 [Westerdykella ornata]
MLEIYKEADGVSPKIHFTHSLLPSYIDPQNVSTKKRPFSAFNAQHFSHTLDLVLPEELYALVRARLESDDFGAAQYARVYMKLADLLERDFLDTYVKRGNVMMRSEGRAHVDNIFSLYDGVLRLELDRPTYERCGLEGRAVEDGGRKHQQGRWVVEFDLRAPHMHHGKKLFGRLEWAAKNVLNTNLTWLFYNFNPGSREALRQGKEPLCIHQPSIMNMRPSAVRIKGVSTPILRAGRLDSVYEEEESLALLEWLHLIFLESPRVRAEDHIDPFLSRYEVPDLGFGVETRKMVRVRWRGFIAPQFVREVFLAVRKEALKIEKEDHDGEGGTRNEEEGRWIAVTGEGFGGDWYTMVQVAGRETLGWESVGGLGG